MPLEYCSAKITKFHPHWFNSVCPEYDSFFLSSFLKRAVIWMLSTFTWGRRLKDWRCSGEVSVQQEIASSWGAKGFTGRARLVSNVSQSGAEEVGGKRCWCRLSGYIYLCEAPEKSNERLAWFRLNQLLPNKSQYKDPGRQWSFQLTATDGLKAGSTRTCCWGWAKLYVVQWLSTCKKAGIFHGHHLLQANTSRPLVKNTHIY